MRYLRPVVIALTMIISAAVSAVAFQMDETVKIGSTEPLTGPGAVYGQPTIIGKMIAIQEINNTTL